ncbi:MAG: hypothetical protein OXE85_15495 [Roseovarius sp.]|nr:hypothetical protein [Roseovarius sp.]
MAVYPNLAEKIAMKIGGKYKPRDVCLPDFNKLVPNAKTAKSATARQIMEMSGKIVDEALELKKSLVIKG